MSMSNVKVSTRLSLGFGAILLIMLALTAIGIWRMQVISDVMVTMTQQDNLRLQETTRWRENTQKNWIRTRAMLLNADPQGPEKNRKPAAPRRRHPAVQRPGPTPRRLPQPAHGADAAKRQRRLRGRPGRIRAQTPGRCLRPSPGAVCRLPAQGLYRNARNRLGPGAPKPNYAGQRRRHHLAAGHLGILGTG